MFRWLNQQKRIEDLENTCSSLEKKVREIELEWDSTYEKFRLLYMRLSKRVKQLDQAPEREDTQPEGGGADSPQSPSTLSPRARLIQAQILARRNARPNGGN